MGTKSVVVGVRMAESLAGRLDEEVERLKREAPGVGWKRAMVMRVALERHLAEPDNDGDPVSWLQE